MSPQQGQSHQFEQAGRIAGALKTGEHSMNQAAIDLLALGTALFKARNSGHFHPLECQREVERIGVATNNLITAIGEIARAHDGFLKKAQEITGTGLLCPIPSPNVMHAPDDNVVELGVAA